MAPAIFSMTGFASGKSQIDQTEFFCEMRSLNSRYLEMYVKLPGPFRDQEDVIKDVIRTRLDRGKINCTITMQTRDDVQEGLVVNEGAVRGYRRLLDEVRRVAGISKEVELSDLLQFKDLFVAQEEDEKIERQLQGIKQLIDEVLLSLNDTRLREGENLQRDLMERLAAIEQLNREIAALGKDNARSEFDKLHKRLFSLIEENKIDRNRLEMELALISDRVDISEEVVRMNSHIAQFRQNLALGSPIGKKLNFILQEMHREANTISSKNSLIEISQKIVTVKEEVERMREQVQNIE